MDNGKYRIGRTALDLHEALGGELAALRVLNGLLHHEWVRSAWRMGDTPDGYFRGYASVKALRQQVGPQGANDARDFRRAVPVLARSGIFDTLELLDRNRALRWNFEIGFAFTMEAETHDRWALLDVNDIRRCRTPVQLRLYCHARQVRGMGAPQFHIGFPPRDPWEAPGAHWKRHWRPLRESIEKVSQLVDVDTVVGTLPEPDGPGVVGVHVKLSHPRTRWRGNTLEQFAPSARAYRYSRGAWDQLRRGGGIP
ncbi:MULTISPECIES: hypothetical protein [Meridianimarinicoccus]|uniref:hypothetical protein n=1 Tax=Meridianimarinicoccus zhengii TaxID=2056810 RepID=UPI000DAD76BE|nr:hypothetical protein [Phycocomes zhengii]